jgi:hypothetical protein
MNILTISFHREDYLYTFPMILLIYFAHAFLVGYSYLLDIACPSGWCHP